MNRTGNRLRSLRTLILLLTLLIPSLEALAQQSVKRNLNAVWVETPPVLDGEVRSDDVWRLIEPSTGFVQRTPDEGMPISQRTELRVVYTDDALYFAFTCYDDDPSSIVVSGSRRDTDVFNQDSVVIILDTYLDEQNGFLFGTNPAGLQYDGQSSKAGEDVFNLNWDGVWDVKTDISEYGWSAEFRIPFKTVRYPREKIQLWGANFQRNIRRRKENAYWSPVGRQFDITRLADAGLLSGLEIAGQRNLKVLPYVLAGASDIGEAGRSNDQDWGVDLKYSLTPSLTLDLTYNTDFAQVEADESQVSLDRFNLFFPEKRPFFLENAGLFTVGKPQQVELFFSRRIGLSADGGIIPIEGGAKVSGSVLGTQLGLMYMQTEAVEGVAPGDRFGVARVKKELPNRSSLGVIFVDRESRGPWQESGWGNRTYGVDGSWGIGEFGLISGYAAETSTPGLDGDDQSWSLSGDYNSPTWSVALDFVEVGRNFNPGAGFLNRSGGYRNASSHILRLIRPANSRIGLLELRPHVSYSGYWDPDGFQETGWLHICNQAEWRNGYEVHTAVNFTHEGLLEPFEIYEDVTIPAGEYENQEVTLYGHTDQGAWISFVLSATVGGFYSGDRIAVESRMQLRLGERFTSELSWIQNDVDLPQGDFVARIGRLRMAYSFTPRISLEALFQYNSVDDLFSSNLRFSWLRQANTGLHIVYDEIEGFDRYAGAEPNRRLVVKYTHLFDFF